MDEIKVLAPATVSNVVCGFDCLGFALTEPYDEITVRKIDDREVRIVHHDGFGLPTEPNKNVAGVALQAVIDAADLGHGFEVEITKHIKPGSGIGSSAASACGAVVTANRLIGDRFSKLELVELAMAGEMIASGARHADNLAPCIFGGFTLVRTTEPLDIVEIQYPKLYATVIHPQIEIKTSEARAILPKDVPLKEAIRNWSNLGSLVAALARGDHDLMARSLEDTIVEPVRKSLIPKFDEVKFAGLAAGAIGGGISGSGPSMFMLSETRKIAEFVSEAVKIVYAETGIDFNIYVSRIHPEGVRFV
ncbi:MAG: homoserine kinase [Pyrinomonadaceae bacterium]|nr:homoserine kinase [Pyrinomonadaceae bacterium]MBP6213169.1 homoserine kinase [Pyrinomonadaceae bacterium]